MNIHDSTGIEVNEFFDQMHHQTGEDYSERKNSLLQNLSDLEEVRLTEEELKWAGRFAWRNSERCIGRLPWKSLKCFDAQGVQSAKKVFEHCLEHLSYSTNGGKIIPTMTFFPHAKASRPFRILNDQLIRYAGYREADQRILGDPSQVRFTALVRKMGWNPPKKRTPFDILPLVIEDSSKTLQCFSIPKEFVLEVSISHPELSWFKELNLKWHALPAIANRSCQVAGLNYSCAPFSGYYMGTEIGARNLGDVQRYNLLPVVAAKMGLDMQSKYSLWKDRALVELNTAVLYSYKLAGVSIIDHHTASEQFMNHLKKEDTRGRSVPGDWSWIVPPMSGSACPVFHRLYSDHRPNPRFTD